MGGTRARLVYACDEDFERMPEVAGGRRCARCDRTIVDLRAVTQRELDALAPKGSICARVRVDAQGVVLARPPEVVPLRRAAAAVAVAATLTACGPERASAPTEPASAEVVASPTPAVDDGPMMLPIDRMPAGDGIPPGDAIPAGDGMPDGGADAATACGSPGASAGADPTAGEAAEIAGAAEIAAEGTPTPEQRARTRRKRRGAAGPSGPPPTFHGGVIMFDH